MRIEILLTDDNGEVLEKALCHEDASLENFEELQDHLTYEYYTAP